MADLRSDVVLMVNTKLVDYDEGNSWSGGGWEGDDPLTVYQDPRMAIDQCDYGAASTTKYLREMGYDAVMALLDEDDTGHTYSHAHTVVFLGSEAWVVDLTFRQYDPSSPWPLVEPVDDYAARNNGARPRDYRDYRRVIASECDWDGRMGLHDRRSGLSEWEPAEPSTCSHPKSYYTERGERCRACGKILRPLTDFKGKPSKGEKK